MASSIIQKPEKKIMEIKQQSSVGGGDPAAGQKRGLMTDNDQLFKLSYKELAIEVTRRCNMQCSHCMRGHAENHTISKEVVDRLLDEVSVVGRLLLTGGEPFLEPEMMDYIFDAIIKTKYTD